MYSTEENVYAKSDYFIHMPSTRAKKLYLYPLIVGDFSYLANYHLKRNNYEGFVLFYIVEGSCSVTTQNFSSVANCGEVVILDCNAQHEYGSDSEYRAIWVHFNGPLARTYFEYIVSEHGHITPSAFTSKIKKLLNKLISHFRQAQPSNESYFSNIIGDILNEIIICNKSIDSHVTLNINMTTSINNITTYILENFQKEILLEELSNMAFISPYHFTRVFQKHTGLPPHQYIIMTRLNNAKYLLKSTNMTIKEVAFSCGFHSESSFCSTFKKRELTTPSLYRLLI